VHKELKVRPLQVQLVLLVHKEPKVHKDPLRKDQQVQ
jgi:hypothetical protein